jgi:hypothetical protein
MEDIPVRAYIPPLGSNQSTKESERGETGGDYVPDIYIYIYINVFLF